jgi:hypothetical protein
MKRFLTLFLIMVMLFSTTSNSYAEESSATPTPEPSTSSPEPSQSPSSSSVPEPVPEVVPTPTPTPVPTTSTQVNLDRQSTSSNAQTRVNVSNNTNAAPSTLATLSNDGNDYVRVGVAQNPNTDTATLQRLANDGNSYVSQFAREQLAKRIPTEVITPTKIIQQSLDTKAVTGNDFVRVEVSQSIDVASTTLIKLSNDGNDYVRVGVAQNPNTDLATLQVLASDGNAWVAKFAQEQILNRTPKTESQKLLDTRSKAVNDYTRLDVSKNIETASSTLIKLSTDGNDYVRVGVAQNPNTDTATLQKMASDGNVWVAKFAQEQILNRTQVFAEQKILENKAVTGNDFVRVDVSKNTNASPSTLARLSSDGNDYVRVGVAQNPNTATDTLQKLVSDGNGWVSQFAIDQLNKRAPLTGVQQVLENRITLGNDFDRVDVAKNANTSVFTLSKLSLNGNDFVRVEVANNPNTDLATLQKLSTDGNIYVAQAANLQLSKKVLFNQIQRDLDNISKVGNDFARVDVANSLQVASSTLSKLSTDGNDYVRVGVAKNPNTDLSTLEKLSKDGNIYVSLYAKDQIAKRSPLTLNQTNLERRVSSTNDYDRLSVAQNAGAASSTLSKLSKDPNDYVRVGVAQNPSTDLSTLQELVKDGNVWVSKFAQEQLALRTNSQVNQINSGQVLDQVLQIPTPTPTISLLPVPTVSPSPSATQTISASPSPILTASPSPSATQTISASPSPILTALPTPSASLSATPTSSTYSSLFATPSPTNNLQRELDSKANVGNDPTRVEVAKNSAAASTTLAKLSTDGNDFVRVFVAANPSTDLNTLYRLTLDLNPFVIESALKEIERRKISNKNDIELALKVIKDKEISESLPQDTLSLLLVSRNPSTSSEVLNFIASNYDSQPAKIAIEKLLLRGFEVESFQKQLSILKENQLELDSVISDPEFELSKINLSKSTIIPEEILVLSADKNDHVRMSLTTNPQTPIEILEILAKDKNFLIASSAKKQLRNSDLSDTSNLTDDLIGEEESGLNLLKSVTDSISNISLGISNFFGFGGNTGSKTVNTLISLNTEEIGLVLDLDFETKSAIAQNAKLLGVRPDLIKVLIQDENPDIRKLVTSNPATPVEMLEILKSDQDPGVRSAAIWQKFLVTNELLQNNNIQFGSLIDAGITNRLAIPPLTQQAAAFAASDKLSTSIIYELASDNRFEVRQSIALNPITPANVLRDMLNDSNPKVANAALVNLTSKKIKFSSPDEFISYASTTINDHTQYAPFLAVDVKDFEKTNNQRNLFTNLINEVSNVKNQIEFSNLLSEDFVKNTSNQKFLDEVGFKLQSLSGINIDQTHNLPPNVGSHFGNNLRISGSLAPSLLDTRGERLTSLTANSESLTPTTCRINAGFIEGTGFGTCILSSSIYDPLKNENISKITFALNIGAPSAQGKNLPVVTNLWWGKPGTVANAFVAPVVSWGRSLTEVPFKGIKASDAPLNWELDQINNSLTKMYDRCDGATPRGSNPDCLIGVTNLADTATVGLAQKELFRLNSLEGISDEAKLSVITLAKQIDTLNLVGEGLKSDLLTKTSQKRTGRQTLITITGALFETPDSSLNVKTTVIIGDDSGCSVNGSSISIYPTIYAQNNTCLIKIEVSGPSLNGEIFNFYKVTKPFNSQRYY